MRDGGSHTRRWLACETGGHRCPNRKRFDAPPCPPEAFRAVDTFSARRKNPHIPDPNTHAGFSLSITNTQNSPAPNKAVRGNVSVLLSHRTVLIVHPEIRTGAHPVRYEGIHFVLVQILRAYIGFAVLVPVVVFTAFAHRFSQNNHLASFRRFPPADELEDRRISPALKFGKQHARRHVVGRYLRNFGRNLAGQHTVFKSEPRNTGQI